MTKLHMRFIKIKSMTGFCNVKVFGVHSVSESCVQLQIDGEPFLRVPTLYDPGSNGAAHTQALEDGVDLYTLNSKIISVQTVSGIEKKDFTRRTLKVKTNQGLIRNYDSIKVNTIVKEEGMVRKYIETFVDLFRMDKEKRE